MLSRSFQRPERTAKRANDTNNRYRTRDIGPQDASASCLVSVHDHILGTHRFGRGFRLRFGCCLRFGFRGGFGFWRDLGLGGRFGFWRYFRLGFRFGFWSVLRLGSGFGFWRDLCFGSVVRLGGGLRLRFWCRRRLDFGCFLGSWGCFSLGGRRNIRRGLRFHSGDGGLTLRGGRCRRLRRLWPVLEPAVRGVCSAAGITTTETRVRSSGKLPTGGVRALRPLLDELGAQLPPAMTRYLIGLFAFEVGVRSVRVRG